MCKSNMGPGPTLRERRTPHIMNNLETYGFLCGLPVAAPRLEPGLPLLPPLICAANVIQPDLATTSLEAG